MRVISCNQELCMVAERKEPRARMCIQARAPARGRVRPWPCARAVEVWCATDPPRWMRTNVRAAALRSALCCASPPPRQHSSNGAAGAQAGEIKSESSFPTQAEIYGQTPKSRRLRKGRRVKWAGGVAEEQANGKKIHQPA